MEASLHFLRDEYRMPDTNPENEAYIWSLWQNSTYAHTYVYDVAISRLTDD